MPFKRSKTTLEVREETPADRKRFEVASHNIESKFTAGYRDLER
jgi:hypothetical protein